MRRKRHPSPMRALVAVSDPVARASAVRALERGRYAVDVTPEWVGAAAKIEAERFDVVIAEVEMPGIGGLDLLRAIRFNHPGTLVFVLGSDASGDDAKHAGDLGAVGFFRKPVDEQELAVQIEVAREEIRSRRLLRSLGIDGGKLRLVG